MQNITDALKLSSAAKAWMGLVGLMLQVGMSYFPAHDNPWYNIAQALLALLALLGIYAVPNVPVEPVQDPGPARHLAVEYEDDVPPVG